VSVPVGNAIGESPAERDGNGDADERRRVLPARHEASSIRARAAFRSSKTARRFSSV
jgi:hypothetical protein